MKNTVILIIILVLAVSCDTKFYAEGSVVDKATKLPLEYVAISVKNLDTIYTNSQGQFHIDTFIHRYTGDFEILLEKEGYKSRHVNFKESQMKQKELFFEMEKLQESGTSTSLSERRVSQMYYFNKYFLSAFNVFTIVFILFRGNLKWRFLWIAGILIFNLTLFLSIADASLSDYKLLNGPVYLMHYSFFPFSVKIVLPVTTFLFWSLWVFKRKCIVRPMKEN